MNKVYCSTGAVIGRPNGRDITLLNKCKDRLNCDGYEFLMYDTWYTELDKIRGFMSTFNKPIPVFHTEKKIGELIGNNTPEDDETAYGLFEINCKLANELGSRKLVLHLWNGIVSDKNLTHNIECYGVLRDIAKSHGLELTVENVICGYNDPISNLKKLIDKYPEATITFDTKMAEFHKQLDLLYNESTADIFERISHIHINDYKGGYKDWDNIRTLHLGRGQIDFVKLFGFLKQKKYKGDFTVEATSFNQNGVIDFDSLNETLSIVRKYVS